MNSRSIHGIAGATLRAVSVAAALALGAGASQAGTASVNITSFTVSAAEFSGNFAYATDAFQSYTLSALEQGGLLGAGSDNFMADNWNLGPNRVATTANTSANGNTIQFTDGLTALTTAGFNLSSSATALYAPPAQPNYANASAQQAGAFVLYDGDGNLTGGTITFDVYYNMAVSTLGGTANNYSQSFLNVMASSDGGASNSFSDGLLSTDFAGGVGSIVSGHFSWTYTLAAGDAAYYTLSGSAISDAALTTVTPVPEPETYAMMMLGLAGVGAMARRRKGAAKAAATTV